MSKTWKTSSPRDFRPTAKRPSWERPKRTRDYLDDYYSQEEEDDDRLRR